MLKDIQCPTSQRIPALTDSSDILRVTELVDTVAAFEKDRNRNRVEFTDTEDIRKQRLPPHTIGTESIGSSLRIELVENLHHERSDLVLGNISLLRSNHDSPEDRIIAQISIMSKTLHIGLCDHLKSIHRILEILTILLQLCTCLLGILTIAILSDFFLESLNVLIISLEAKGENGIQNHHRRAIEFILSILVNHFRIDTHRSGLCEKTIEFIDHFHGRLALILVRIKLPIQSFFVGENLFEKFELLLFGEIFKSLQFFDTLVEFKTHSYNLLLKYSIEMIVDFSIE